jgi:hypothetical protein
MQRYTVYLYLETAVQVSGGISTHHQERIQLYRQHLVFVTPLLLSAAMAAGSSKDINKLCNVASCWIYNGTYRVVYQSKVKKLCILFALIVLTYHDARSSECQIQMNVKLL